METVTQQINWKRRKEQIPFEKSSRKSLTLSKILFSDLGNLL